MRTLITKIGKKAKKLNIIYCVLQKNKKKQNNNKKTYIKLKRNGSLCLCFDLKFLLYIMPHNRIVLAYELLCNLYNNG